MRIKKPSIERVVVLASFAVILTATGAPAVAQLERVLHSFNTNGYGYTPVASVICDAAGNLYGTTPVGGFASGGIVFEIVPKTGGGWTAKTLHNFSGRNGDGFDPTASLIFDAAGNLYGTTNSGGAFGMGIVFELSPSAGGNWTETVLYSFGNSGSDGQNPQAALVFDAAGNLYGTTHQGGTYSMGTVFELSPAAGGGWTESVLHSFGSGSDGQYPQAAVILDPAGNLFGTTIEGGSYNNGTVFELKRSGTEWNETILHHFSPNGSDGVIPFAGVTMDKNGNLYGTTNYGGVHGYGTVFEVRPANQTEKILHNFSGGPADGMYPTAGLIFDASGNLYGTTTDGGAIGSGIVFEMLPAKSGWAEKVLHNFNSGTNQDGSFPDAGVVFDALGNLYGTTYAGGSYASGTVFEIKP
jgi:uncharacterized repeat protein (TIGR03803 family)